MLLKSESSSPHSRLLSDKSSCAWEAATHEWPVNLTQIIDRVAKRGYRSKDDGVVQSQAHTFIQQLSALKYELTHNKTILVDNEVYKTQLEAMGRPKWMDVPWIFAESVLNLRICAIFALPADFKDTDQSVEDGPHSEINDLMNLARAWQWNEPARAHRSRILSNASTFHWHMERLKQKLPAPQSAELERSIFRSFCQHSLWARAIERSFLPSQTSIDFLKYSEPSSHILVDDTQAVYKVLEGARAEHKEQRRVDIILDRDGIELSNNLLLAVFLLERQLATKVVLHAPRSLQDPIVPTTSTYLEDFATIYQMSEGSDSIDDGLPSAEDLPLPGPDSVERNYLSSLNELLEKWQNGGQGALTIQEDPFWSMWYSFWELQEYAPELLKQFQEAEVVIVKGDFNYRKLTEDVEWPTSTPFAKAIGPMGAEYGVRTLSLRTIESNTVVGLKEGQDPTLRKERAPSPLQEGERGTQLDTRKWEWNGGFVLMQFCDGKAM